MPAVLAAVNLDCYKEICSIPINSGPDRIDWLDGIKPTNHTFKSLCFYSDADVDWSTSVWFKGCSLKFSMFSWMAMVGDLKTSDNFAKRNLGEILLCPLCNGSPESHGHLFFECSISFWVIKNLFPDGHLFLIAPNIQQVFHVAFEQQHKVLTRLYLLITSVAIFVLWTERNARLFNNSSSSPFNLLLNIKRRIAFKLRRWKFKVTWPDEVVQELEIWKSGINDFIC